MFLADGQHSRAACQDGRQFWRMLQALDGAVSDEDATGQRGHHWAETAYGLRRAGGADGYRSRDRPHGQHDMEHPRAQSQQGKFGQLAQVGAALRLRQHGA
ncbi:MAG: hypothetical protein ACK55I_29260, partial [bacterium]